LGGKEQKSDYKIDCRWSPKYLCKEIDKLHALFSRLNIDGGVCHCKDFSEILKECKDDSICYLDPPYYVKGNDLYQCGFTKEDHSRLSNVVKDLKGEWILSYDDCEEIRSIYNWAHAEKIDVNYSIGGATTKSELLIYDNRQK
jgi:DNA adenine methylase